MKYIIFALFISTAANAGLFGPTPNTIPSSLPSPVAENIAITQLHSLGQQVFNNLYQVDQKITALIWNTPNLNPQEFFQKIDAAPGGYAGEQCDTQAKMLAIKAFLNAAVPGTSLAQPKTVTTSGSGSSCVVIVAP